MPNRYYFCQRHVYSWMLLAFVILNSSSFNGQTSVTLYPDKDAMINSQFANMNQGGSATFQARAWTIIASTKIGRSLIEFDLSSIPSNATITSASLTLYGIAHLEKGASYLQRVNASWDETTVTWNNQPTSTTTNQISLADPTSPTENYSLNVTTHVQDMINVPSGNHGFLMKLKTESPTSLLQFGSSDNTDPLKHPKLDITYTVPPTVIAVNSIVHKKVTCSGGVIPPSYGAIDITPSGGGTGSTYTYSWTGPSAFSATTQDLTGLTQEGLYTVTVTPSIGTPTSLTIGVGYSTDYGQFVGTQEIVNGNEVNIQNTSGTNTWCRSAGSRNILASGVDGWIEYKATSTNIHRMIALSDYSKTGNCWDNSDYGIYLKNNGQIIKLVNTAQTVLGTYAIGDLIRVYRDGATGTITFYKNGVDLGSPATGAFTGEMKGYVSIWTNGGVVENMACSFSPPMEVTATITNLLCGETTGGEISITPCGVGPYTYSWSPGMQTTATISNLSAGTNTVTISGPGNWIVRKTYSVGYDMNWTNQANVIVTGNTVEKTSGSGIVWDAGANSDVKLPASTDGWIEYEVVEVNKDRIFGYTEAPVTGHPNTSVDYGVRLKADASFVRTMSGTESIVLGTLKKGSIIKIEKDQATSTGYYYVDGFRYTMGTVGAMASIESLYAEIAQYTLNGKFENVRWSSSECPLLSVSVAQTDAVDCTLGTIDLTITGGRTPYQIHWLEDSYLSEVDFNTIKGNKAPFLTSIGINPLMLNTLLYSDYVNSFNNANLTNVNPGRYPVYVYDDQGIRIENFIEVSSNLVVAENVGLDITSGVVSKPTGITDWATYFRSANIVGDDELGFFKIRVDNITSEYAIGLRPVNAIAGTNPYDDIAYGVMVLNDQLYILESGVQTLIGTIVAGDEISIEKDRQSNINYYKNGTLLQLTAGANNVYHLKSNVQTLGSSYTILKNPGKRCPFINMESLTQLECGQTATGAIDVTIISDALITSIQWTDGLGVALPEPSTEDQKDLNPGVYTITVTDNLGLTSSRTFKIGYKTIWKDKLNITCEANPNYNNIFPTVAGGGNAKSNNLLLTSIKGWQGFEIMELQSGDNDNDVDVRFSNLDQTKYAGMFTLDFTPTNNRVYYYSYVETTPVYLGTSFGNTKYEIKRNDVVNTFTYSIEPDVIFSAIAPLFTATGTAQFSDDIEVETHLNGSSNTKMKDHINSFDCRPFISEYDSYAKLRKKVDGGYHTVTALGMLNFMFIEEYNDLDVTLEYKVYDKFNLLVTLTQPLTSIYGDNRYELDVSALIIGDYYTLEVINEKNEKWYVRFKR